MKPETLERLLADRAAKKPVILVTDLTSGDEQIVYPDDSATLAPALADAVRAVARSDRSETIEVDGRSLFLHVYNPPLRMIVVGAVHIAQPLARMAAMTGYDVIIVDPRAAFATEDRFPGVTIHNEWPDDAMAVLRPDTRTAIVTLTHDPKIDDPALETALKSRAFYIGALGSKKTHNARLYRLHKNGFSENETARIHGPVGLDIGAKSPAEIAVAILGQVTDRLRRPT